jgi:hypothetical protein
MVGTIWIRSFLDTDMLVGNDGQPSLRPYLTVNDTEETDDHKVFYYNCRMFLRSF